MEPFLAVHSDDPSISEPREIGPGQGLKQTRKHASACVHDYKSAVGMVNAGSYNHEEESLFTTDQVLILSRP